MFGEPLVTVFFRLLNFAALIGLAYYVFKKYFRTSMEEAIEQERLEEIDTTNRISELQERGITLDTQEKKQEELCQYLIERTDEWKKGYGEQLDAQSKQQHSLQEKHIARTQLKMHALEQSRLADKILPETLHNTKNQLTIFFSDPTRAAEYTREVISFIEKES